MVINKHDRLPGEGIGWFLTDKDNFSSLSLAQKRKIVGVALARVFAYPRWREVLSTLSLPYAPPNFSKEVWQAATFGGGEGESHRRLKEFVAQNPQVVGLAKTIAKGKIEQALASGDALDVSFEVGSEWIAAEVKPLSSPVADITRGLFQCVKYRAVMEASQAVNAREQNARAILVLGGALPVELIPLRNTLGVVVIEHVVP